MIEGTMKWLSVTKQFGFVAPDDGSRDVFVRFSSGTSSGSTNGEHTAGGIAADVLPTVEGPGEESQPLRLATKVEVRTR
jgi:hypothetical protein